MKWMKTLPLRCNVNRSAPNLMSKRSTMLKSSYDKIDLNHRFSFILQSNSNYIALKIDPPLMNPYHSSPLWGQLIIIYSFFISFCRLSKWWWSLSLFLEFVGKRITDDFETLYSDKAHYFNQFNDSTHIK